MPARGFLPIGREPFSQIRRGPTAARDRHLGGRSDRHHTAALIAGAGADVDDPVAAPADDPHVVLGNDHGVARRRPGRRAGSSACRRRPGAGRWSARRARTACRPRCGAAVRCELDALGFAARQLGRRLAQPQVAETDFARARQARGRRAARRRRSHSAASTVMPSTRRCSCPRYWISSVFGVVARAMAGRAGCVDARQEQQLDHDEALALARLAPPFRDVEGESSRVVAAAPWLPASMRTACGPYRRGPCTSRGSTAASARSASDRLAQAV